MNCLFCQKPSNDPPEDNITSCASCRDWVMYSGDFGLIFTGDLFDELKNLESVYYHLIDGLEDDIYYALDVHFNFVDKTTVIVERRTEDDTTVVDSLLTLPLLPITREFIETLPDKLKLWLTFS